MESPVRYGANPYNLTGDFFVLFCYRNVICDIIRKTFFTGDIYEFLQLIRDRASA